MFNSGLSSVIAKGVWGTNYIAYFKPSKDIYKIFQIGNNAVIPQNSKTVMVSDELGFVIGGVDLQLSTLKTSLYSFTLPDYRQVRKNKNLIQEAKLELKQSMIVGKDCFSVTATEKHIYTLGGRISSEIYDESRTEHSET